MKWHIIYGKWWMLQWQFAWWFSFGVHIDFKRRINSTTKKQYSPYMDIHLFWLILSIGVNPYESLAEIHKR